MKGLLGIINQTANLILNILPTIKEKEYLPLQLSITRPMLDRLYLERHSEYYLQGLDKENA